MRQEEAVISVTVNFVTWHHSYYYCYSFSLMDWFHCRRSAFSCYFAFFFHVTLYYISSNFSIVVSQQRERQINEEQPTYPGFQSIIWAPETKKNSLDDIIMRLFIFYDLTKLLESHKRHCTTFFSEAYQYSWWLLNGHICVKISWSFLLRF